MSNQDKHQIAFVINELIGLRKLIKTLDCVLWLIAATTSGILLATLQLSFQDGPADWAFLCLVLPSIAAQIYIALCIRKMRNE